MTERSILVCGAGLMGHAIAQEFATGGGFLVRLHDQGEEPLRKALDNIDGNLAFLERMGRLTPKEVASARSRIEVDTDLRAAVADVDVVVEAVFEDLALKQTIFHEVDAWAPERAIIASNTSSFMPSLLAAATRRPDRVLVAHYFNPPHLLPLVELVRGPETSDETVATMRDLYVGLGKSPAVVQKEAPGFVGNRLQMALFREALAIAAQGIASPQDIDTVVKTGFGRRLAVAGPFEVFDLAGLDVTLAVAEQLFPSIESSDEVPSILCERVERGEVGAKSGQGFYSWTPESATSLRERIGQALLAIAELPER